MKIERIPEYLLRWGVTLFGILLSIYLVRQAGFSNYGRIVLVMTAILLLGAVLILREKIWVLIPLAWPLTGQIPELGIPLTVRDMVISVVFGSFLALKAFKMVPRKVTWGWSQLAATLVVLYLAVSWIRNPVGLESLKSDRVGGRPYFTIFIALLAGWVLNQCSVRGVRAHAMTLSVVVARAFEGLIALSLQWAPSFGWFFEAFYAFPSLMWVIAPEKVAMTAIEDQRMGYLAALGLPLGLYLVSLARPMSLLNPMRIWRPALLVISVICIFLSGFRSVLALLCLYALVSGYFRNGWLEVWKMVGVGALALVFLILCNGLLFDLPHNVQRTLSFLPGNWSREARQDAGSSTEWRVQMWKEMLSGNRYIENHMLGDGFGFRRRDLQIINHYLQFGTAQDQQESYMINGGVHSGPVSAIRYAGYVGLAMILVLLFSLSVRAWKLLRRAQHGSLQILAYFICLPVIVEPFYFIVIFGAYENTVPDSIYTVGLLQMLQNSIEDEEAVQAAADSADLYGQSTHEIPELAAAR
jgi:hypothetical protein